MQGVYLIGMTFCCFRISSNTDKQYKGRTSFTNDPHVQTVDVPDAHQCDLFQVSFTDNELKSREKIYKKLDKTRGKKETFVFLTN